MTHNQSVASQPYGPRVGPSHCQPLPVGARPGEDFAPAAMLDLGPNDDDLTGRRPFNNWEGVRKLSWPMTAIGLAVGALSLLLSSLATLLLLAAATAASGILSRPDLLLAMFQAVGVVSRFVLPVVIPGALFLLAIVGCRLADRLATVSGPPLLALWTRTGLAVFVGAALAASVLPTYVALASGTSASKLLVALAWSLLPLVPSALVAGLIGIPITGLLRWRRGYPCRRDYLPLEPPASSLPSTAAPLAA